MSPFSVNFCLHEDGSPYNSGDLKGKFVQIHHEKCGEFAVFAPLSLCAYHAQIVEIFCRTQSPPWAFELSRKGDNGHPLDDSLHILGGGYFELCDRDHWLRLNGASQAYGEYQVYGFEEKLSGHERFRGYKITL